MIVTIPDTCPWENNSRPKLDDPRCKGCEILGRCRGYPAIEPGVGKKWTKEQLMRLLIKKEGELEMREQKSYCGHAKCIEEAKTRGEKRMREFLRRGRK